MKITKIIIDNYKSIKHLDFEPNPGLNAFIGENNTGKSNIFEAINWLLGPRYPTFNSTQKSDHYLGDEENKIFISMQFDNGYTLTLDERALKYNFSISLNEQWQKDLSSLREKFCCAYIDNKRTIVDYLPSDKWSLLGRLLQDINKKFLEETIQEGDKEVKKSEKLKEELDKIRDGLLFSVENADGKKVMNDFIDIIKRESAEQLNRSIDDFEVNLNLYDPWDFYKTLQIIVNEKDIDLKFQASQLGMGAQASITIAILKAYSAIQLGGENPIFIDEPELFLHPQAQRNFYKILRTLAKEKNIQIFYTTHSADFLNTGKFNEIFLVRKIKDQGTSLFFCDLQKFITDLKIRTGKDTDPETLLEYYRNACDNTGDSQKANEGFFAKKIILVEGQSENLIMPYFFELVKYDYIKEGITIVRCGNKDEIDRFYRLYSEFGIPCYIVFDGDKQLEGDPVNKKANIQKNRIIMNMFGETVSSDYPDNVVHDKYLGFEYELEQNLRFIVPEDKKGLELYLQVKEVIKDSAKVPSWVKEIIDKIQKISQLDVNSILKSTLEEGKEAESKELTEEEDITGLPF